MSECEKLKVEILDQTALVTLCHPPANTWDEESLSYLPVLLAKLKENQSVRSLVITGEGEKFFSAGADLNMFADGACYKPVVYAVTNGTEYATVPNISRQLVASSSKARITHAGVH